MTLLNFVGQYLWSFVAKDRFYWRDGMEIDSRLRRAWRSAKLQAAYKREFRLAQARMGTR